MDEVICAAYGDCLKISDLQCLGPGEGLWCKNVLAIKEQVTIGGMGEFFIEQKLPFELFIIRKSCRRREEDLP